MPALSDQIVARNELKAIHRKCSRYKRSRTHIYFDPSHISPHSVPHTYTHIHIWCDWLNYSFHGCAATRNLNASTRDVYDVRRHIRYKFICSPIVHMWTHGPFRFGPVPAIKWNRLKLNWMAAPTLKCCVSTNASDAHCTHWECTNTANNMSIY